MTQVFLCMEMCDKTARHDKSGIISVQYRVAESEVKRLTPPPSCQNF